MEPEMNKEKMDHDLGVGGTMGDHQEFSSDDGAAYPDPYAEQFMELDFSDLIDLCLEESLGESMTASGPAWVTERGEKQPSSHTMVGTDLISATPQPLLSDTAETEKKHLCNSMDLNEAVQLFNQVLDSPGELQDGKITLYASPSSEPAVSTTAPATATTELGIKPGLSLYAGTSEAFEDLLDIGSAQRAVTMSNILASSAGIAPALVQFGRASIATDCDTQEDLSDTCSARRAASMPDILTFSAGTNPVPVQLGRATLATDCDTLGTDTGPSNAALLTCQPQHGALLMFGYDGKRATSHIMAVNKPANDCGTLMTLTHPPTEGDDGASVQLAELPANLGKVNAVKGGHHQDW